MKENETTPTPAKTIAAAANRRFASDRMKARITAPQGIVQDFNGKIRDGEPFGNARLYAQSWTVKLLVGRNYSRQPAIARIVRLAFEEVLGTI